MQTQTRVKLKVRPFTADDYADITRLHNANFPGFRTRTSRPNLLPTGYFVAVVGDEYVGVSNLWLSPVAGELRTGTTGVQREWRRRGIALALKVRSLEFAKKQGYLRVATENETNNHRMIAINDRLGFAKQPAYV